MGRYFSVLFAPGAPVPDASVRLVNDDNVARPDTQFPGMMCRFALGIGYSTANGLAARLAKDAGFTWNEETNCFDLVGVTRFPWLRDFAKFIAGDDGGDCAWTHEECVGIAADMTRFFDEWRAARAAAHHEENEVDAEQFAEFIAKQGYDADNPPPYTREDLYEPESDRDVYSALHDEYPYGNTICAIFTEAVARGGFVATN